MSRAPILAAALLLLAGSAFGRTLSFEERVRAQEAVERVYYLHQAGATEPFEKAVPPDLVERKVRETLRKSLALDRIWHAPITAATLARETERMAFSTRLPERLEEIYAALGRDRFLFEETVARAAVADRLTRRFFSADQRIHAAAWAEARSLGAAIDDRDDALQVRVPFLEAGTPAIAVVRVPKRSWEDFWSETGKTFDPRELLPVSTPRTGLPEPRMRGVRGSRAACLPDDSWDNASLDAMPGARSFATTVWTGSEMIVWGGGNIYGNLGTGGRYDPATDTWRATSAQGAPIPRSDHTAVWTGSRMIVWGGNGDGIGVVLASGGIYDPATDSWTPVGLPGAPAARAYHTAVWTGSALLIWGGLDQNDVALGTGGRYDPVADQWSATATTGAPTARAEHTAVWTGTRMIVWGGWDGGSGYLATGARYDPVSDAWTSLPAAGSLAGRRFHAAVWTGARMVVWGGLGSGGARFRDGARYDPVANTWSPTSMTNAPAARYAHVGVWTGARMIVWGGVDSAFALLATGGAYDPVANVWSATSTTGAPAGRYRHHGVWADGLFLVWGGTTQSGSTSDGGRYDPASDSWTPTSNGPIAGRERHTAVWTGNRMIVWGGDLNEQQCTGTGAAYDPALDVWSSTTGAGAPQPRYSHSAAWTGTEMVVWGGWGCPGTVGTGGRYDPVRDSWAATATAGAPEARDQHSAIWTGTRMIVWGGVNGSNVYLRSGGIYDPDADTWTPTVQNGAPAFGRSQHSAVWTGSRMLIWGGSIPSSPFHTNTGGLYDPLADAWTPTTLTGAPTVRSGHDTVWTGSEMVVWGGLTTGGVLLSDGFRYDPAADTWVAIATSGAPTARSAPSSVWTGKEMILWGGNENGDIVSTGFRYDPDANTWAPMTTQGAPPARSSHTAVWTGSFMIPWGGFDTAGVNTGGRYAIDNAVDLDGDGLSSCDGDCNDADPGALAVPEEIQGLVATSPATWIWESGAAGSGPGTVHDVVRGDVATLPVGSPGEVCLASGIPGSTATDASIPAPGGAFFYLVRARNSCGDGGYGAASSADPRDTDSCP